MPPPSSESRAKPPPPAVGGKVSDLKNMIGAGIKVGPPPPKSKPSKMLAVVIFDYKPDQPDELELVEGDMVEVLKQVSVL